ncbi:MAG: helix-turn-helix domain-containing protein [Butyricicoccus sp.]
MGADPHAVRMTISRLKQKLGGEDARVTVNSYRSSGYRLEEQ